MTPLYIALLNRIIKKITLYMEATMTFDTGWHVNPLVGAERIETGWPAGGAGRNYKGLLVNLDNEFDTQTIYI
jgi:hypothetical protein